MTTDRNLTETELFEIFGEHYTFCFNLLDVTINTKNVNKAENLMDNGYNAEEIKRMLPYQGWLNQNATKI
jgi:hypothetical protein